MSTILTLVGKDWRLFWADRRAAVLYFLVPIVLASAFGMIFNRPSAIADGPVRLPLLIVVEDDGLFTGRIAQDLLSSTRVEAKMATRAEAEAAVMSRRPAIAIIFPQGFERLKDWQPSQAEKPVVHILHHPTATAERQWGERIATEAVMRRFAREKFGDPLQGMDEGGVATPFRVEMDAVSDRLGNRFNSYSHSFCGMTVQYLLFWGMESGLLFLRERQRGVWYRMRAAPVSIGSVLAAKALATALIALLQIMATFGFGYLVFGVQVTGSFIGFVLLALAACGLAAATGLLVAAIGGTEARARSVSILVILGVSMVGGLWLPAFLLPEWVRDVSLSLPTSWAMRGLGAVTWQGVGLWSVLPSILAVSAFAAVFLSVAAIRLKRSEQLLRAGIG